MLTRPSLWHTLKIPAIILNFRRPSNIAAIVRACHESGRVSPIYIIDQADTGNRLQLIPDGVIYQRLQNAGAGRRVSLAVELGFPQFLGIDDDLFLSPQQIATLVEAGQDEARRLHGLWGQIIDWDSGSPQLISGIRNVDREVDILNRVYVYTRDHALRAIQIAADMGYRDWNNVGPVDDIFLSISGEQRPLCHNLGPILDCPTSNDPQIAVWLQPGFEDVRQELMLRLVQRA